MAPVLSGANGGLATHPDCAAERYATRFADKADFPSRFPEAGRPRPEIAADVRSTLVKPYVIFYRYRQDTVQILRILHGRRDLRRIMEEEPGD